MLQLRTVAVIGRRDKPRVGHLAAPTAERGEEQAVDARARWRRPALAAALVAILGLGCAPASPAAERALPAPADAARPPLPAASTPPALLPVRSAFSTLAVNNSLFWIALDGGYFHEQGLDVELVHINSGAPMLAAMQNGEVGVSSAGGATVVLGYLQGLETRLIGATTNVMDSVVFTRPEIKNLQDLRGKTVGVTRIKSLSDVAGRMAFRQLGLQPEVDVFMRGVGGQAEMLAAMETGATDGAVLGMPLIYEARKAGYQELIDITALRLPFLQGGIGVTKRVLDERPAEADRYLRAVAQAAHRLQSDREFAMDVVGKY